MQCKKKVNCSEQWMSLALSGHLLGTKGSTLTETSDKFEIQGSH